MRQHKKELVWIAAAFLLLCAVSAYRQIGARLLPDDPVRPLAAYLVYLLLLAGWWGTVRVRMARGNMRFFLLAEQALMLLWLTTRLIQDSLLYRDAYLMRVSGYLIALPLVLLPLFGLYAAFGLGKAEEYRFHRAWYLLLLPAGLLIILMLTNESHHLVFRTLGEARPTLYFHPNGGLYLLIAWAFALELLRLFLIYHRSRQTAGNIRYRLAPFLLAAFMLVFSTPYLAFSFVVRYEFIEYSALLFFLEALVWESCILSGMVPVNSRYEEVFDRSTVAMQIVTEDGQTCLKSTAAPELPPGILEQLKQWGTVTREGQELHLHGIRGGYAIWQTDISGTLALIEQLQQSAQKQEYEGELLRQELHIRSDEAAVREQNRIYSRLSEEVGGQLTLLSGLLEKQQWEADKDALFQKICLVGTYIKRRCNLRLIEQTAGEIDNQELRLCYEELLDSLRRMGVGADLVWSAKPALAPEFAISTLDLFQFLLEHEHLEPTSVSVRLDEDAAFAVQVCSEGAASGRLPNTQLERRSGCYGMTCLADGAGYRVCLYGGR